MPEAIILLLSLFFDSYPSCVFVFLFFLAWPTSELLTRFMQTIHETKISLN